MTTFSIPDRFSTKNEGLALTLGLSEMGIDDFHLVDPVSRTVKFVSELTHDAVQKLQQEGFGVVDEQQE